MFDHRNDAPGARPHAFWLLGLAAAALLTFSVSACNTMSGMGKDVEAAGGAMSDTAEDTKDDMTE